MRLVIKGEQDIAALNNKLATIPDEGWLVQVSKHAKPRTLSQNRKIHAMISELADFTGERDMKGFLKSLNFWPTAIVTQLGVESEMPISEMHLTAQQESQLIEDVYMVGAFLDGFEWSDE